MSLERRRRPSFWSPVEQVQPFLMRGFLILLLLQLLMMKATVAFSSLGRSTSNYQERHQHVRDSLHHRTFFSLPSSASTSVTQTRSSLWASPRSDGTTTTKKLSSEKIPIILLSGFLGAGKTSTLQEWLQNDNGMELGVLVNDVAAVNIDSKLVVRTQNNRQANVVELQNGCACCSLADEFLVSLEQLIDSRKSQIRPFDAIVVELSGVADPSAMIANYHRAEQDGLASVTNQAEISHIVTLIDASTFGTNWMSMDQAGDRWGNDDGEEMSECSAERQIPELLAEQVEAADVVLLNKMDLADPTQIRTATALAESLMNNKDKNDERQREPILRTVQFGKVPLEWIFQRKEEESPSNDEVKESACCSNINCSGTATKEKVKQQQETPVSNSKSRKSMDQLGISSFVYRADRPFAPKQLLTLLSQWPVPIKDDLDLQALQSKAKDGYMDATSIPTEGGDDESSPTMVTSPFIGVLRSKGFLWMAPTQWDNDHEKGGDAWRHDIAMYWSHAGKHFGITPAGPWWASWTPEELDHHFQDKDPALREQLTEREFVSDEWGDRRQELVFIGVGIDHAKITRAMDECLVSENVGMTHYRRELNSFRRRCQLAQEEQALQ